MKALNVDSPAPALFAKSSRMRHGLLFVICCALLLLPWAIRLDGRPHGDWEQFLGRFHPLAVHLPIGLLVLVPIFEVLGASRPALKEAAGVVLDLAAVCCLGTLCLGYLLAHGAGETGGTLVRHMWGAIALTIGVLLCRLARSAWTAHTPTRVYPWLLLAVLATLVWTAHQGGVLTHGSGYLNEFMPAWLKKIAPRQQAEAPSSAPDSVYALAVHPIFDKNCLSCHGSSKTEGGLRLDTYNRLLKGGRGGSVIVAGNPEQSVLLQRITLPKSDKHFMPREHPPLNEKQIGLLRTWIRQGASGTATAVAGIALPSPGANQPLPPVGDYSQLSGAIAAMQMQPGAKLTPLSSRPSDGLVLNTVDIASSFGDAQLAALAKFAPYIVEANLARTAVSDNCLATLATFTNLRALHLEGTSITGHDLSRLAALKQLQYLNLSDTRVTKESLAQLQSMKQLKHLYLFNTPAEQENTQASTQTAAAAK